MGRVVAANAVPDAQCLQDLLKKLDNEDPNRPEPVKLLTQQRQDLLPRCPAEGRQVGLPQRMAA